MAARIFASLLVLGSATFLLTNCSSTDAGAGTPAAGNTGIAGSSAGAAAGGAPAGGGGSAAIGGGGSTSVGGAGSAGMPSGGTAGTTSAGGASAGAAQGGSGGSRAGAGGQASGGGSSAGAGGSGGAGAFALTSSKLAEGAAFATEFTCASNPNHSPPLAWTPGPSAALSYALVLLDTNNSFNHWVVWDMPPSTSMLIESLPTTANLSMPAGAKQVSGQGAGYLGPCPGGTSHTYKFTIYALDVATLPGVTTSSMSLDVATAVQAHDIASASLSGTSNAKRP